MKMIDSQSTVMHSAPSKFARIELRTNSFLLFFSLGHCELRERMNQLRNFIDSNRPATVFVMVSSINTHS